MSSIIQYLSQPVRYIVKAELSDAQKRMVDKEVSKHPKQVFSDAVFGDSDRIVLPFDKEFDVEPNYEVAKVLEDVDIKVTNYLQGMGIDKHGRSVKIGRILTRLAGKDPNARAALAYFETDPARKTKATGMKIIISRNPYDVTGMSTDRGWSSCMNLNGNMEQKAHLKNDLKQGTHVAYLVNGEDMDIRHPVARVALKPFIPVQKTRSPTDTILVPETKVYGIAPDSFLKKIEGWTATNFPVNPAIDYKMAPGLYVDSPRQHIYSKKKMAKIASTTSDRAAITDIMATKDLNLISKLIHNENFHVYAYHDKIPREVFDLALDPANMSNIHRLNDFARYAPSDIQEKALLNHPDINVQMASMSESNQAALEEYYKKVFIDKNPVPYLDRVSPNEENLELLERSVIYSANKDLLEIIAANTQRRSSKADLIKKDKRFARKFMSEPDMWGPIALNGNDADKLVVAKAIVDAYPTADEVAKEKFMKIIPRLLMKMSHSHNVDRIDSKGIADIQSKIDYVQAMDKDTYSIFKSNDPDDPDAPTYGNGTRAVRPIGEGKVISNGDLAKWIHETTDRNKLLQRVGRMPTHDLEDALYNRIYYLQHLPGAKAEY